MMENFRIEMDAEGVALVLFDVPGRSVNLITASVLGELPLLAERVRDDDAIKAVILASGKDAGFCAGLDLQAFDLSGSTEEQFDRVLSFNRALRALETCGKPVACAIEGTALGGGLEIALACHYRVAADNPGVRIGLPESKIGLLPGGGGTQRLPRLIGVQAAALMILQGQEKSPQEALGMGIVHAVAPPGGAIAAARAWIAGKPSAVAPWDAPGFRVKDGPFTPAGAMIMIGGNAMVSKETNLNYPAQANILSCFYEGLQLPIDQALRVEARYFLKTAHTPQARAMMRTLFVSMQALSKGSNRPGNFPRTTIGTAGVIGAGLMGAGIAYVQAKAGIDTILIDVSDEKAEKGKDHARALVDKDVARGRISREKGDALLARIVTGTDYAALAGADLVIEAVFENPALKAEVIAKVEAELGEGAMFGSNTSTLPITGLAEASKRPGDFIGVHFFSPVERMGLVEIIRGRATSDAAVARAIDYVHAIRKTPIVVNDARGFYTSRCFSTYTEEGLQMLVEGIAAPIIENVGRQCGMPMGPLEVSDSVGLDTALKVGGQLAAAAGRDYATDPLGRVLGWIVEEEKRIGRKAGKGFYDYDASGKATGLWPGVAAKIPASTRECPPALKVELTRRLLFRQCLEVARCFEEAVITDPRDADVGSILAWGFAPWSGGCVSYIDLFWGSAAFVAEADRLADAHGERFRPNALLREMAARGESFYARFGSPSRGSGQPSG